MMKTLKFRSKLAELILSGAKTTTWRLFDDKELKEGDVLSLVRWEDGKEFAKARIVSLREKQLGAITEDDFEGHDRFDSEEQMYQVFRKYYGDDVDENTSVKIVRFELLWS